MEKELKHIGMGLRTSCEIVHPQTIKKPLEEIVTIDNKKIFGKSSLEKRNNIYMLHLEGTQYEMGFQHGILLKEEIKKGVVPYYLIKNVTKRGLAERNLEPPPLLKFFLMKYVNWSIISKFKTRIPQSAKEEMKGIADASGIPYETFLRLVVLPDTTAKVLDTSYKLKEFCNNSLGCSSFVATKNAVKGGKLIHARNLDYEGVGFWDKYPLVIFYHPNNEQSYVSISTAGVGLAGITSMNESGLTLALHQNYSKEVSNIGTPIIAIGNEVIRKAHNIRESVQIIKKLCPAGGWTFVISDWKTNETRAIEVSAKEVIVRKMEGNLLYNTNHYITPEMKLEERSISQATTINSHARYQRLEQLLKQNFGKIDIALAAKFLGDHYDPIVKKERGLINCLTRMGNLGSVIFLPEEGSIWVANGRAPVSNSTYVGFNMKNESKQLPNYQGNKLSSSKKISAMHNYVKAYQAYFQKGNNKKALSILKKCITEDPKEPSYHDSYAWIQLKEKNYEKALQTFEKAITLKQTSYRKALNYLWLAHTQDLLKLRDKAKENYYKVTKTNQTPALVNSALKGLKKAYSEKQIKKLDFNFALSEVVTK